MLVLLMFHRDECIYPVRLMGGRVMNKFPFSIFVMNSSNGRGGGPLMTLPSLSK